jgi:hypothetical protein
MKKNKTFNCSQIGAKDDYLAAGNCLGIPLYIIISEGNAKITYPTI